MNHKEHEGHKGHKGKAWCPSCLDFEQRSRNPVFACPAQETYQNQPVSTSKGSHKGAKIRVSGHIRSFVQSPIVSFVFFVVEPFGSG
jgi:hypothetical protein